MVWALLCRNSYGVEGVIGAAYSSFGEAQAARHSHESSYNSGRLASTYRVEERTDDGLELGPTPSQSRIEIVLSDKLIELAPQFADRTLCILNIGVYPWYSYIELSMYFADEGPRTSRYVGDWAHYNVSAVQEGRWPAGDALGNEMLAAWEWTEDAAPLFRRTAAAAAAPLVRTAIGNYVLAHEFEVEVLDADSPELKNYYLSHR